MRNTMYIDRARYDKLDKYFRGTLMFLDCLVVTEPDGTNTIIKNRGDLSVPQRVDQKGWGYSE